MSRLLLQIGPAKADWSEEEPLKWMMTEEVPIGRNGNVLRTETHSANFDLTSHASGYRPEFLLAFKQMIIERRTRLSLSSLKTEFSALKKIFSTIQCAVGAISEEHGVTVPMYKRVDRDFLTAMWGLSEQIPTGYLKVFKAFFSRERENPELFEPGLALVDCPSARASSSYTGLVGGLRQQVLASALSRSMLVQLLNITQEAYENGNLSLDVYAYSRLTMSKVLRPESMRLLRCKDLIIELHDGKTNYYLKVSLPKAKTSVRPEVTLPLHDEVGRILEQQRKAVSERLANLVETKNTRLDPAEAPYTLGELPLFPAAPHGHMSQAAEDRLGFMSSQSLCHKTYIDYIKNLTNINFNHNVMRHSMGTQLAVMRCSASTIAAVLLHATESTARVYVDLLFEGAIDALSDSLESAFAEHFPVFKTLMSVDDPIAPERRVESVTSKDEIVMTGGCRRELICSYAPIVCYDCPRFIPCYDVDHSANLELVEEEIRWAEEGGLARKTEAEKYKHIANRIRVVIAICDKKRNAVQAERNKAGLTT